MVALAAVLLGLMACGESEPAEAPEISSEWRDYTTETASYRILTRVGPTVSMDVLRMGATMTVVDQGQPVNHHIEVHVFDRNSGAEVKDLVPIVAIKDRSTDESRELGVEAHASGEVPYMRACLLTKHRAKEPHFGDNLYLRDGTYAISVSVGEEAAVSENVVVTATGA
jgi:hypothetical protein